METTYGLAHERALAAFRLSFESRHFGLCRPMEEPSEKATSPPWAPIRSVTGRLLCLSRVTPLTGFPDLAIA
jgi:hypothetical protein